MAQQAEAGNFPKRLLWARRLASIKCSSNANRKPSIDNAAKRYIPGAYPDKFFALACARSLAQPTADETTNKTIC